MATATQSPSAAPAAGTVGTDSGSFDGHGQFLSQCGHVLRVFGSGRHRRYFEPEDTALADPVMNGVCPDCGRGLPGKQ